MPITRQFRRECTSVVSVIVLLMITIYVINDFLHLDWFDVDLTDNAMIAQDLPLLVTLKYAMQPSATILDSLIPGVSAIFSAVLPSHASTSTSPSRTENMQKIEMQTGIQINYFAAITPSDRVFKDNYDLNGWAVGESDRKRLNQAGCHFSHVAVWHEIVARNLEFTLIFEDDGDVEQMFKYKMQEIHSKENDKWPDLLLLGHCMTRGETSDYIAPVKAFYCTHAYGLTLTGAKRLLRHLDHFQFAPVDIAMRHVVENGWLDAKGVFPPIVRQLPRGLFGGGGVSGSDELPEQLLEDPVVMSNDVYKAFLVKKEDKGDSAILKTI